MGLDARGLLAFWREETGRRENAAADDKKVNDIAGHYRAGTPPFLSAPDPITDIKETKDYDVVIVGAGAAGVPAAIFPPKAESATVALIQKEATAISQGNTATGILLDGSDPRGVSRSGVHAVERAPPPRQPRAQGAWAKNSGEAITWIFDLAQKVGAGFRHHQEVDVRRANRERLPLSEPFVHRFRPEAL